MFLLDGRPLSPDCAFSHNGVNYPSNWLRLSTLEEKKAIGITEVPDPPTWDQRFYWGYDEHGDLIPKDHGQLVEQWIGQTRTTAGTLLLPTDWQIIRETDNGTVIDSKIKTWREDIRLACNEKVIYIGTTNDTPELAAYITGAAYPIWPRDPYSLGPVSADTPDNGVQPVGNQSTGGVITFSGDDTIVFNSGSTSSGISFSTSDSFSF
jgi:hypothetical protein